ncbi:hypothetical protein AAHA92_12648 [Salvia divinorum]|uniref:Aspartic peptidase DDI1-type domain-containing protein n=1 Tax=Salvia divinorum TaxID=28513 RepID=A0ABD1HPB5_SALDI
MDMLNKQLSQIATSLNEMRGTEGRIPATVKKPGKDNVSMITLRPSGSKVTDELTKKTGQEEDDLQRKDLRASLPKSTNPFFLELEMANEKKESKEKEEVLLPKSASKRIIIDKNPPVIQELPSKHADPGVFTLPITVGGEEIDHAICDLGASINIIPLSMFQRMEKTMMTYTDRVIQLADGSCIKPVGILENATIKVRNFLYPADFHVIRMSNTESAGVSRVLLGSPFLKTAKAIIDVFEGTISLRYHGKKYTFGDDRTTLSMDMELNAVMVAEPPEQEASEEEKMEEKLAGEVRKLKEEAAEWLENVKTQGPTDQELSKANLSFCQVPITETAKESCQEDRIARMPKLREQKLLMIEDGVSAKEIIGKAACDVPGRRITTKKLRSIYEVEYGSEYSIEAVWEREKRKAVEQEDEIKLEKKGVKGIDERREKTPVGEKEGSIPLAERPRGKNIGRKSILPLTNPTTLWPETGERQGKLKSEKPKAIKLKVGQGTLFLQSRLIMMPSRWKPKWTKPITMGAGRADRPDWPRGRPFHSKSLIFYCPWERVSKDGSGLCVGREISLRITTLSFI